MSARALVEGNWLDGEVAGESGARSRGLALLGSTGCDEEDVTSADEPGIAAGLGVEDEGEEGVCGVSGAASLVFTEESS